MILLSYSLNTVLCCSFRQRQTQNDKLSLCLVSPESSFRLILIFNLLKESIISLSLVVHSRHWLAINTTCCSPPMASGDLVRTEWWMDGDQVPQPGKMSLTGSVGVSGVNEVGCDYLQVWLIQDESLSEWGLNGTRWGMAMIERAQAAVELKQTCSAVDQLGGDKSEGPNFPSCSGKSWRNEGLCFH